MRALTSGLNCLKKTRLLRMLKTHCEVEVNLDAVAFAAAVTLDVVVAVGVATVVDE